MAVPYAIAPNQTTAFVNEMFPTTGILGTSLYESDPEPRVRPGTVIAAVTGNGRAVYAKTHAVLAAGAACKVQPGTGADAGFTVTASGSGYNAIVPHKAAGRYGWFITSADNGAYSGAPASALPPPNSGTLGPNGNGDPGTF